MRTHARYPKRRTKRTTWPKNWEKVNGCDSAPHKQGLAEATNTSKKKSFTSSAQPERPKHKQTLSSHCNQRGICCWSSVPSESLMRSAPAKTSSTGRMAAPIAARAPTSPVAVRPLHLTHSTRFTALCCADEFWTGSNPSRQTLAWGHTIVECL